MIAWRESAELLRRCVRALEGQSVDQLIVSRSTGAEFSDSLTLEFPDIEWVEDGGACDLPQLQWQALLEVRSDVAAFLEAPSIPGPGWADAHRQAHAAHPETLACGGPVRIPEGANAWELGWYWSDYAAYAAGRLSGQTRDLSDANVSYKLRQLRANESLLAEAVWGWRIRKAGALTSYYETSAWIDYPCPYPATTALQQRWSAGRGHGAVRRTGIVGRVWSFVTAPLLPIVLAWRGWGQARSTQCGWIYLQALPWVLAFHIWWTCGELAGLVSGRRAH